MDETPKTNINIKGFFRLQIEENGHIVGDSGFKENLVTNLGFKLYLADLIGKSSGSKQIGYMAIGTGGAPSASDTSLSGEIMASTQRGAVTYANVSSKTAQFTCTFASSNSFITGSSNISNVGLFSTTTTSDTLMCGNSYASSSLSTNQNLNCTYELRFSTVLPFIMALLGAAATMSGMA